MLEAIKYQRGCLKIIDQLLLPSKTHYENIDGVKAGWAAINSMKVIFTIPRFDNLFITYILG